jgi:hypothetical protein
VRGTLLPVPFVTSAPPPPRSPRSWWQPRTLVVGAAVAVMVTLLFFAGGPRHSPASLTAPKPLATAMATASPAHTAAEVVNRELAAQSQALLSGDLSRYLAPVDAHLRDEFTVRFGSLRALGVATWNARVTGTPAPLDGQRWRMTVRIGYCLGAADCTQADLRLPYHVVDCRRPCGRRVVPAHRAALGSDATASRRRAAGHRGRT